MLPGDGIGPEVMQQTNRVINWFDKNTEVGFDIEEELVGGASYDKYNTPITANKVLTKKIVTNDFS